MSGALLSLALGVVLAAAGAESTGGRPARLAVRAGVISSAGAEPELAPNEIFDRIERTVAYARSIELVPREQLSSEVDDAARRCGADVACLAAMLVDKTDADFALSVVASLVPPYLVSVRLIDCSARRILGQELKQLAAESAVAGAVEELVVVLLEKAGHPLGGRVVVDTSPAEARVWLARGVLPDVEVARESAVELAPGTDREEVHVTARLEGYFERTQPVVVERGKESRVAIVLEREPSFVESPWLWIGAAAVVVAGATAVILLTRGDGDYQLCQEHPMTPCE